MELWTAFLLGLVGSLHCAGMCGPLALALPATSGRRFSFVVGRAAYNLGRVFTYTTLGALCGLAGRMLAMAGLQRALSLGAGIVLIAGVILSSRRTLGSPITRWVVWLKSRLASLLQPRTLRSVILLGALNGLLPCGLVYVACAGAAVSGRLAGGAGYMLAFGLGTVPMMLAISLAGRKLQPARRLKLQRLIPVCVLLVGALLILRGMSLGVPYLSPDLSSVEIHRPACH